MLNWNVNIQNVGKEASISKQFTFHILLLYLLRLADDYVSSVLSFRKKNCRKEFRKKKGKNSHINVVNNYL